MSRFDISNEAMQNIAKSYSEYVSEVTNKMMAAIDELAEISTKTQFKPLMDYINKLSFYYNNELKQIVMREFEKWQLSPSSFTSAVERMDSSASDAIGQAQRIENGLNEDLSEIFHLKADALGHELTELSISDEDFDNFIHIVHKYFEGSESIASVSEDAVDRLKNSAEENSAFLLIEPLIVGLSAELSATLGNYKKATESGKENFAMSQSTLVSSVEEVSGQVKQSNNSLNDIFKVFSENNGIS